MDKPRLHWVPERKFLAGGLAGIAAWLVSLVTVRYLGIDVPLEVLGPFIVSAGTSAYYLVPPSAQDVLRRIDSDLKRQFALEEIAAADSAIEADLSRVRRAAGSVAQVVLAMLLLGGLAIGGPVACANYQAQQAEAASPATKLYAVQADYNAALAAAVGYAESDAADPGVVAAIARLDRVAWSALGDAQRAVRAGDGIAIAASMAIARAAVGELVAFVSARVGGAS